MPDARRRWPARVLFVLGGVLAGLGLLAGHMNRVVLDGPTFAEKVDEVRRSDAVSTELGQAIAQQILVANPDLVALRPLVESVAIRVAGSDLLSGPVQAAARTAHRALTEENADLVVLRVSDAAAVVTAALAVAAPERAPVTTDVSVTLAEVGDQSFASTTIAIAHTVDLLAWVLPLLALACLIGAVVLSTDRWRGVTFASAALVGAAAGVGLLLVVGGVVVRRFDADTLSGAFTQEAWRVFMRPLWWSVLVLAVAGVALGSAAGSAAPETVLQLGTRLRGRVLRPPTSPAGVALRAAAAALLGVAVIADPTGMVELAALTIGVALVLYALALLSRLAAPARERARQGAADASTAAAPAPRHRSRTIGGVVAAGVVLVAGVVWMARPGDSAPVALAGTGEVCNGHAELCDRPFDQVAYAASHNAMSVAGAPGWFLGEQADPIPVQLDQGVRALLVDVWSGRPSGSVVRTAASSYEEALAVAEEELGPEVVAAALRIADSVAGAAQGPEARYLCHGLCETGSTPFVPTLVELRGWLVTHPDEVVTLFIEDHVDAALIAADVEAAGLLPLVYAPVVGEAWPTLREMIQSGQRLVVMVENGAGGDAAPWLVNGFDVTQETPYTFPTVDDFSCAPNRGPADAPLFQMNHWLFGFRSLVTDAQLVNARDVLLPRAEQCRDERGQIPNFVAVNYVAIGDLFDVVDELNGVG